MALNHLTETQKKTIVVDDIALEKGLTAGAIYEGVKRMINTNEPMENVAPFIIWLREQRDLRGDMCGLTESNIKSLEFFL
jgi:hypothetical protein